MESLYLLIPIALVFCVIAIKLLLWAITVDRSAPAFAAAAVLAVWCVGAFG